MRWGDSFSNFIKLKCGVRQGGVLSAYFFAVYIDDIIKIIQRSGFGCHIGSVSVNIFLYADDILLMAPSVGALQNMLSLCENHLAYLDMTLNAKKSVCLRVGRQFKDECSPLTTLSGESLCWVDNCRYLGVYLEAGKKFKSSLSNNKKSFYRAFNAIYGKVGGRASEEVVVKLISAKCVPVLIYGLDASSVSLTDKRTLDFIITRTFMRVFKTSSIDIVNECQLRFNFRKISETVVVRKRSFLHRYALCDNSVCSFFASAARSELLLT